LTDLPHVDVHQVEVGAEPAAAWRAVSDAMGSDPGLLTRLGARALGCREVVPGGPRPLAEGSTLCGFRVVRAEPPNELALEGSHRFSDYDLTFRVETAGPGRSRIWAATHAHFPGPLGRLYRAAVIGTGGHVLAMRRLLRGIARRAERAAP
jgi:hypothetical protein